MATTRHSSPDERGGRKVFVANKERLCTHTPKEKAGGEKLSENPIFTNIKKRIRARRASSKAARLFLTK